MAGFLNAIVPIGQVLGTYKQASDVAANVRARRQKLESGVDSLLAGLGPEFEPFRQARKAGMPVEDLGAIISGPIGGAIRQQVTQHKLQEIFQGEGTREQKIAAAVQAGVLSPEKAFELTKPDQAKGGFETYVHDVLGMTPEQFRGLPEEQRSGAFKQFAHRSGAAGDTVLKPVYDPKAGVTRWTYVPKSGAAGSSVGEVRPTLGASAQAEEATTRVGLQQLGVTIDKMKAGTSAMPTWAVYAKMKAGLPVDQDSLAMLGQVSVLNTTLTGLVLRSWGSRNPVAAQEIINLHVPKVGDSPKLLKQKIQEWLRPGGYLDQYRAMSGAIPMNEMGSPMGEAGESGWVDAE